MNNKPVEKDIKKWCRALRSGRYSQTIHRLEDKYGYCCLGVAVKEFLPENKLIKEGSYLLGELPRAQNNSPKWIKEIDNDFRYKTGTKLSELNDEKDFTFDEIADVLESVYIHRILD